MTFIAGYKSRVVCGDFLFSAYITDWSEPFTVDMHDVTVPTSTGAAKQFITGMTSATLTMKGFLDPDGTADAQYDQINDWQGANAEAVSFGPSGLAFGSELILTSGLVAKSETGATTTTPVSFGLDVQNTGLANRNGVSLHDNTAETADGSSAAYNGGASSSAGFVAHLHTTAFSGLTSNVVTIEDSANGSTGWAVIGTFTTVTGLTQERIEVAGAVRQYVRATWDVTGTGSTAFIVGFARK